MPAMFELGNGIFQLGNMKMQAMFELENDIF